MDKELESWLLVSSGVPWGKAHKMLIILPLKEYSRKGYQEGAQCSGGQRLSFGVRPAGFHQALSTD